MQFRLPTFGPTQMVLTLALLLLGLFAYAFLQTAAQSYRLRDAERDLFMEVQVLRDQKAELEGLAAYLESDEYVEAFARQQFGLVRPGETLVEVDAPPPVADKRHPGERWWEALFDTSAAASPSLTKAGDQIGPQVTTTSQADDDDPSGGGTSDDEESSQP